MLVTVGCVWWAVAAFLRSGDPRETDADHAERVAGLYHEQHPGKGRYYVPTDAVLSRTADGVQVAYLYYGLDGGDDVNLDDFLTTYDLPQPGAPGPLPEDLRAALPGDEPSEGALAPEGQAGRQIFVVERPSDSFASGAADVYVRATGT
ncbi:MULTISPECIES: hypothetical protein [Streptomyces]|uniref:hypothetical protein n=1 Tax=Streptomyces TaxID=1883 RepID=UPI000ADEEDD8|nr:MULTISPECIES: hypothetical protein [Streptomyces]